MGNDEGQIAVTPEPPYVAVIFTSLRTEGDVGYAETARVRGELAAEQPGYLGIESARGGDGLGITVSYWRDEDAARGWKNVAEHLVAQRLGRETWYHEYRVRVASVTRDYGYAVRDTDETSNARTIDSYGRRTQEYIDGTPHEVSGTVKEWLDRAVAGVLRDARILELGSAFGRDAAYLASLGYRVECTDATPAFVDVLRATGLGARVLNAITDELPRNVDVVLANAVLLHYTRDEAADVIGKVYGSLKPGGTFAFTLKLGEGEEWTEAKLGAPRFFCYWTQPEIRGVLTAVGFADVTIWTSRHRVGGSEWLLVIARKTGS